MKIGIITHYYKSENYGGNLQAFALCKVLNGLGYQAEQISLVRNKPQKNIKGKIKDILDELMKVSHLSCYRSIALRKNKILEFNLNEIPHSDVYHESDIYLSNDKYDAFITGSDQVWHPSAYCDAYLLNFVLEKKIKISYAASVATNELSEKNKKDFYNAFKTFDAISVRENSTVCILKDLAAQQIQVTLDPTLLLSKEEWLNYLQKIDIPSKYVFCYFLGECEEGQKAAIDYAKVTNSKIVNLPYLLGKHRKIDDSFGDYKLFDVSPRQLLFLIKNAECVFTDSFHATVFSAVFEKEFWVFSRKGAESMSIRLNTLLEIFNLNNRLCKDASEVESTIHIDYNGRFDRLLKEKEKSIAFLKDNLSR